MLTRISRKVYQARKKDTGRIYAMKVIRKRLARKNNISNHVISERNILKNVSLGHPFIANLYWAFQTKVSIE